ncbi:hypothetical protein ASPZODRAFT_73491 [Penicilliopsis zonata CBS 506.65]|uniref:GAR domain-containing protein n=1 Tax=Penicilliopsis zonata CBS 506.65 TaxID=1073090 RepID=A0A1L9S9L1_9EURO|nr:hypothetical protein ASPZODRAFT_73491 [Penicilliopsis zonata CBS 506.65]OJJ43844.1 hypothetical protein ASPZODRAFT_73491 [Penicilliopsis zonata CBS 506.65]
MASGRLSPMRPLLSGHARTDSQASDKTLTPSSYHATDPLLSSLSPEATIAALSSTDLVPTTEKTAHDILWKSISKVSAAERALGIRAAIAAQQLNRWYKEVQEWQWPKGTDAHLGKGFVPPPPSSSSPPPSTTVDVHRDYYGSLPAEVVEQHEKRVEEIRDGMDGLNVEELKEHVLNAHIPARSRPSSSTSTISVPPPLSYVQLSDFTAIITATILRALPFLSRLNRLLSTWDVRLLVLRQIPGLLHALKFARAALDSSFASIRSPNPPSENDDCYSRVTFHARRAEMEAMVVATGRRMDRILDSLDGREDALPEAWIDDLEAIESDFSTWVVEAERQTVENEWKRFKAPKKEENIQQRPTTDPVIKPVDQEPESVVNNGGSAPSKSIIDQRQPIHSLMETIDEEEPSEVPRPSDTVEPLADTTLPASGYSSENEHSDSTDVSTDAVKDNNDSCVLLEQETEVLLPPCESQANPASITTSLEPETEPETEPVERLDVPTFNPETVNPEACQAETPISGDHTEAKSPISIQIDHPLVEDDTSPQDPVETSESLSSKNNGEASSSSDESEAQIVLDSKLESTTRSLARPASPSKIESNLIEVTVETSPTLPSPTVEHPVIQDEVLLPPPPSSSHQLQSTTDLVEQKSTDCVIETTTPARSITKATPESTPTNSVIIHTEHRPSSAASEKLTNFSSTSTSPPPSSPEQVQQQQQQSNVSVSFIPSVETTSKEPEPPSHAEDEVKSVPRQPLESPIKLSRGRLGHLDLKKGPRKTHHRRHVSDGSADSLSSDYPSLISSPEVRETGTASSNATPLLLETPPHFQMDCITPPNADHTLREDRLLHLNSHQKTSPRSSFKHSRTVSLPLQRFINERVDFPFADEHAFDSGHPNPPTRESATSAEIGVSHSEQHVIGSPATIKQPSPENNVSLHSPDQQQSGPDQPAEENSVVENTGTDIHSSADVPSCTGSPRLLLEPPTVRKRMMTRRSMEGLGLWKEETRGARPDSGASTPEFKLSAPPRMAKKPRDQLDEKISSILNTIPANIELVDPSVHDLDGSSMVSSLPTTRRERFRSASIQGTPTRSNTPTPSITLMPAVSRRRHSHAFATEDSSVKLYHLHRSGKSVPQKLFIRTVGVNGERVMVRVGGGWADLGEYLREYAIHHGRQKATEAPQVEVQGLTPQDSPVYSSPGTALTPTTAARRSPPSRPLSVMSYRPASSLAVHRSRRASNVSDMSDFRDINHDHHASNGSISPMSSAVFPASRRRLSVSSNQSMTSFMSESHAGPSVPLGLAGPLPRSRNVSMTPESEAWVEDVLGQARKNASLKPNRYASLTVSDRDLNGPKTISKARSVSDMGTVGLSKRVALRGLANRKL